MTCSRIRDASSVPGWEFESTIGICVLEVFVINLDCHPAIARFMKAKAASVLGFEFENIPTLPS